MKISVIQKAHRFVTKTLKNKTDIHTITCYLQSIGYTISLYDNSEEEKLIRKHDLDERVKIIHAFTIVDGSTKFIYVNSALSAENKKYSILHEMAHIVLGHLDSDDIIYNERLREMEADTFAYTVLNPPRSNKLPFITTIVLAVILSFTLGVYSAPKAVPTSSVPYATETVTEMEYVYVTKTGQKYHRDSCIHAKGKECTKIILEEAQKNYDACSVCNPK